jgi:hypothetical protein
LTADCTESDPASLLIRFVSRFGIRAVVSTCQVPEATCPKGLLDRRGCSHLPSNARPRRFLCGRPNTAVPLLSSDYCQVFAATPGIVPWHHHHCRSVACASMLILNASLIPQPLDSRIQDLQYGKCAARGSCEARHSVHGAQLPLSSFFPLGYPNVLPQTWAQRRQDFGVCCVRQAVASLPGADLAFYLAISYRTHHSSRSTTVVRHGNWLCRRSGVFEFPPLCRFTPVEPRPSRQCSLLAIAPPPGW